MSKGEHCILTTTPQYAFGAMGCPPRIPPNTSLEYEIKLNYFENPKEEKIKFVSLKERIDKAQESRQEGNDLFKHEFYRKAIKCYNKAFSYFNGLYDLIESEEKELNQARIPLYLNLATCNLKLDEISKAIKNAQRVIEIDPNNAKAHFRIGQAYLASSEFQLSLHHIIKAATFDPTNKEFRTELEVVKKKIEEHKEYQKKHQAFRGIFVSSPNKST